VFSCLSQPSVCVCVKVCARAYVRTFVFVLHMFFYTRAHVHKKHTYRIELAALCG